MSEYFIKQKCHWWNGPNSIPYY